MHIDKLGRAARRQPWQLGIAQAASFYFYSDSGLSKMFLAIKKKPLHNDTCQEHCLFA